MLSRFIRTIFNTSGTWTAPAGVTTILVYGMGGGTGATGGTTQTTNNVLQYGGMGSPLVPRTITVVPNTTYTITIGAGGAGSVGEATPSNGTDTSFGSHVWFGHLAAQAGIATYRMNTITSIPTLNYDFAVFSYPGKLGVSPPLSVIGGTRRGGVGGISGELVGGTGGDGVSSGAGNNGGNAPDNSGAGGGSGGNGSTGTSTGGSGGSGQIVVLWVE